MAELLSRTRETTVAAILEDDTCPQLVTGPFGAGKTRVLGSLEDRLIAREYVVLRVVVPPGEGPGDGIGRTLDQFRQTLDISRQLGEQLKQFGHPRLAKATATLTRKAQIAPIRVQQTISASGRAIVHANGAQGLQIQWGDHLGVLDRALGDHVVEAITRAGRRRRVALLIDDVQHLDEKRGVAWLLELVRTLHGVRVVAARRGAAADTVLGRVFRSHGLGPLSRDDVAAHLAQRLGAGAEPALVDHVCLVTGRLAWGVGVLAEGLARARGETAGPPVVPTGPLELDELFGHVLAALPGELRTALEQLAVLREFDRAAAVHMLGAGGTPPDRAEAVLDELVDALLVETGVLGRDPRTRSADVAHAPTSLRLPELVRRVAGTSARAQGPARPAELHRRAADFYQAAVDAAGAETGDPFAHWSALEGGLARRYFSEWVHHVAHAEPRLRSETRSKIIRWYLEGFFWYEWKVPHWFCSSLLSYCAEIRRTNEDVEWLDCLAALHQNYPRGWRKAAEPAVWRRAIDALTHLRTTGWQPAGPPAEVTDAGQVFALATHLLAECFHYSGASPQAAEERYLEAAEWYVGEHNDWNRRYARLHRIDLAVTYDLREVAPGELTELLEYARGVGDVEMFCLALRVAADAHLRRGELRHAAAAIAAATLHALAYQAKQLLLPQMHNFPDGYTREVYLEMIARTDALVAEVRERDAAVAARVEAALVDLFAPFWDGGAGEREAMLPPPPSDRDLGVGDGDYVRRVRWLAEIRSRHLWRVTVDPEGLGLEA
ncbi:hypothetical protein AMES_6865 [Amycolatopsis mediterranei S699]|uniref:Orc1-like AAA ATPase domain-containing protein n=2 Tax=Amycolatopsis mediterranei TaxID=33910 RepID=A0A0H3DDA9_AMYMU|nr:AAA family ATPase [Amycolatopsis mediterranei]ADJ48691.1 hypothetical protein AMED_6972 [Amycolatopsis mediterranei U32]AEK45626.1 hypothetical protein RAM_35765 [Amycolatopsis mediterranei S699]AFO80400.1 hypothetical protein AMES_6865 [Amycolatopsis mediterranei S699]AGT87528.1 hypothetical protein B737_6865 [Amycolatopsis mediterranei RB]KDO03906.1 hypothetical protein DV26_45305 [Amycolatopsis mediterranei]